VSDSPRATEGRTPSDDRAAASRWTLSLTVEQCITGIVGGNRDALTALAFGLARTWDPEYVWVEFDEAILTARTPIERQVRAHTPQERWHSLSAMEDLGPDDANWKSVQARTSATPGTLSPDDAARSYFSRLPLPLRRLAQDLQSVRRPTVVVLANMDRIADLYPNDPDSSRRYFRAGMGEYVSLIVTFCGPLRRNRESADVVLLPRGAPDERWENLVVDVERASLGPFARDPSPFRIDELPAANELFAASIVPGLVPRARRAPASSGGVR
jgi:hypothetical protein